MRTAKVAFRVSSSGRADLKDRVGVLELEPLGPSADGAARKVVRDLRAPIGSKAAAETVTVPVGQYVARVRLPSGEQVNELVVITDNAQQKFSLGAPRPIVRKTKKDSVLHVALPRVVRTYEQSDVGGIGAVRQRDTMYSVSPSSDTNFPWAFDFAAAPQGDETHGLSPAVVLATNSTEPTLAGHLTARSRSGLPDRPKLAAMPLIEVAGCIGGHGQLLKRLAMQSTTLTKPFKDEAWFDGLGLRVGGAPLHLAGSTRNRTRVRLDESDLHSRRDVTYAAVSAIPWGDSPLARSAVGKVKLIRLPGTWRRISGGGAEEVILDIDQKPGRGPFSATVRINDPQFQSIIGFTQQNDLMGALVVLENSLELLMMKMTNRYAAAAAGYVLLNAPAEKLPSYWHEWIGNLGRRFNDLPDGAIQHATLLLQRAPSQRDSFANTDYFPFHRLDRIRKAANLILESLERGLPLYRAGFGHLASNLQILVDDPTLPQDLVEPVGLAQRFVNSLRLRLDITQPFTMLDIS